MIKIPNDAIEIIEKLEAHGFEAYVVGGCVRDTIMGRSPNDWDIATSATPYQVKRVFKRTYDTGIEHGTVTVIVDVEHFEITTYRTENTYTDHRRPSGVNFVDDIKTDLSRRDFTINAIAYHPKRGFIDPYNGIEDIKSKCIRCVGDANERFSEDALRILRAIRFSAQLNFVIDEPTTQAVIKIGHLLKFISKERIRDEFTKTLLSNKPNTINNIQCLGLMKYISSELDSPDIMIDFISPKAKNLRYSELFLKHGISFNIAQKILRDLRWDNQTIKQVGLIIKYYEYPIDDKIEVKRLLRQMGIEVFEEMLQLRGVQNKFPEAYNECFTIADLAISGEDIIANGIPKGKVVGEKLEMSLEHVLKFPEDNKKELLLKRL